jgi:DNA-binding LacI/PurR family transcriptional regulator
MAYKYKEIYESIKKDIEDGVLSQGDKVPSEQALAKELGISFLTVRKALNLLDKEGLIVRRVGLGSFVANKKKSTTTNPAIGKFGIGVLMLPDPGIFTLSMIEALDNVAVDKKLFINVRPIRKFNSTALKAVTQLKRSGCVAIVIPHFSEYDGNQLKEFIEKSELPVTMPEPFTGLENNCFYRSGFSGHLDFSILNIAFNCLKSKGIRHIAYLGPKQGVAAPADRRIKAYELVVERFGYKPILGLVGNSYEEVDHIVNSWAENYKKIGVITFDDNYAFRLLTALHKFSYSIPNQFAVIGANNSPESLTSDPALTSIALPYKDIALGLIDHALAMSRGGKKQLETVGAPKLVIRDSV